MGYVHDIHLDRDFDRTALAAAVRDIRGAVQTVGAAGRGPIRKARHDARTRR